MTLLEPLQITVCNSAEVEVIAETQWQEQRLIVVHDPIRAADEPRPVLLESTRLKKKRSAEGCGLSDRWMNGRLARPKTRALPKLWCLSDSSRLISRSHLIQVISNYSS